MSDHEKVLGYLQHGVGTRQVEIRNEMVSVVGSADRMDRRGWHRVGHVGKLLRCMAAGEPAP